MDFDADGDSDVLTGSWPGELYFFERNNGGEFEPGAKILDENEQPINAGNASTVFAVDWDADNDLDLVLGDIAGNVQLITNQGTLAQPKYGKPEVLELGSVARNRGGDSGPIVADWNADEKNDLIVPFGDGSVVWFQNVGSKVEPKFDEGTELVRESGFGFDFSKFEPGMWGARVKVCAIDWNSDGRLDLLVGDRSGKVVNLSEDRGDGADEEELKSTERNQPETTRHGYVWVFLREALEDSAGAKHASSD